MPQASHGELFSAIEAGSLFIIVQWVQTNLQKIGIPFTDSVCGQIEAAVSKLRQDVELNVIGSICCQLIQLSHVRRCLPGHTM